MVSRTCSWCGAVFAINAYRADHGRGAFCSNDCRWASYRSDQIERFWCKVDRSGGPDACWPWQGHIMPDGYGRTRFDGRDQAAHRVAWEITNGPLPDGLLACHDCPGGDNRACCNPRHLFPGTYTDNNRDMIKKGRMARGDAHHNSKLTEAIVVAAREQYAAGAILTDLAAKYGVGMGTIRDAIRGKNWRHAGGPISPPKYSRHSSQK
jgi:hypothetical protein